MTTIWGPGPTEYRFFWPFEVASFASEEEAETFVRRFKEDPAVMTGFRRLLDPMGTSFQDDDDELIDATATLLAGGDLIADLITTTSFEPMWQYYELFRDRYFALHFVSRFRRDPVAVARFRGILRQLSLGANISPLTMDQVFAAIANLLATERLIPTFRLHAAAGSTSKDEKLVPTRPSSPTAAAPAPAAAGEEDEAPTFPDNDGASQAAALRAAAATGVPFCEECAKAAAARSAQQV